MVHSFSSLEMFSQCPRKYYEHKVLKMHPYKESPATAHGNRVHAAFEAYLKTRKPLPEDLAHYQWVCEGIIDNLSPAARAEVEFSFKADGSLCGLKDWKNKHFMGLADVLDIDGTHAFIADWKTGKSGYPKPEQIELMALFTFLMFDQVETVSGMLLFVDDGTAVPEDGSARWSRADMPALLAKWLQRTAAVERHVETKSWPATPNNLCGWCECTSCPHHAPAQAKREAKAARFNS